MPRGKSTNHINNGSALSSSGSYPQPLFQNLSASDFVSQLIEEALQRKQAIPFDTEKKVDDLVGILPDWAIRELILQNIIKIDPLPEGWESLVDEVTIDFHLGNVLKVFNRDGLNTIDTKYSSRDEIESMMQTVVLKPGQPFILTENEFVIAATRERLTLPDNIIGHLNGKSSLARLGVVIHSTAARFDPGWDGCPVLEFSTFLKGKKIVIYEGSPICAFSFEKMAASCERTYMQRPTSKYGGSTLPVVADEPGVRKTEKRS